MELYVSSSDRMKVFHATCIEKFIFTFTSVRYFFHEKWTFLFKSLEKPECMDLKFGNCLHGQLYQVSVLNGQKFTNILLEWSSSYIYEVQKYNVIYIYRLMNMNKSDIILSSAF